MTVNAAGPSRPSPGACASLAAASDPKVSAFSKSLDVGLIEDALSPAWRRQ